MLSWCKMILFLFSLLVNSKHSWTDNNSIKICRRNLNKIDMLSRIADGVQRSSFLDTYPPYCSTSILVLATVPDSMILTISVNLYRWTPVLSLLCWIVRWSAHLLLLNFILVIVECMLCGFVLCWLYHVVLELMHVFFISVIYLKVAADYAQFCTMWNT